MIRGIGTDIVIIDRIKTIIGRTPSFVEKAFTEQEKIYFEKKNNNPETIAANFAVKEAFSKALGTGVRGFGLKDEELIHDELGKPSINISTKIKEKFNLDECKIHVSISHSSKDAIAFIVIEEVR